MLDVKIDTLLAVVETQNFTKAAEMLSLTQPAVSHHINQLEKELGISLFVRRKNQMTLTSEGKIVVQYARRLKALHAKMYTKLQDAGRHLTRIRVGITPTSESNLITEVLAKYGNENAGVSITLVTDTIKNIYDALENYELDLAIVESSFKTANLNSLMLDTDYIVCVVSKNNPLAKKAIVTLDDLKKERMILRLPTSATRVLFESHLASVNESIEDFNISLEVDNIATIKDLIRKDLGVSILACSACMAEVRKGKLVILPIENLSMIREMNIVYHKDFSHVDVLQDIIHLYHRVAQQQK